MPGASCKKKSGKQKRMEESAAYPEGPSDARRLQQKEIRQAE